MVQLSAGIRKFERFFLRVFNWFFSRKALLVLTLAPVLLILLGGGLWQWYQNTQKEQRLETFAKIEEIFNKENKEFEKNKNSIRNDIKLLEKKALKISQNKLLKKKQKSIEEEKRQQREKLTKLRAIHKVSIAQYRDFFDRHKATEAGVAAGLRLLSYDVTNKRFIKAKKFVKYLLKLGKPYDFYNYHINFLAISIYTELKEYDRALFQLEKFLKSSPSFLKSKILLKKMKLLILNKKNNEVGKVLAILKKQYAETRETKDAVILQWMVL